MSYLQPMDTRQYLYCLKPKPEFAEKAGVIKGVTVIGKLDIVWKTNLGERGRLQTSQLQRMVQSKLSVPLHTTSHVQDWGASTSQVTSCLHFYSGVKIHTETFGCSCCFLQAPGYGDVRLSLELVPDTVNIEEPFDITCKITNCRYRDCVCVCVCE